MMHEFDKALQAYQKVSNTFDQNDAKNLQDMADVHVKISNIHQVKGELSQALGYLQRAYQSYNECLHSATAVIDNQKQQQFLALKIVEVTCGIANIYIDQGETEKSSYKYKVG
jgi:tetratricopeptide (TPR) repeat protein